MMRPLLSVLAMLFTAASATCVPAIAQSAPAAPTPPDGTYTYAITQGGRSAGATAVTIVHAAGALAIRERGQLGPQTLASDTALDAATLREKRYTIRASGTTVVVAVDGTLATMQLPGTTLPLQAPAGAASILVFDGLMSTPAFLPAYLKATNGAPLAFATTLSPHAVAIAVAPSKGTRPAAAAAGDMGTDLTFDGGTATIWYDPVSLVVDGMQLPGAGLEYRLTSRSPSVAVDPLAAVAVPTPVALPAARYTSRDVSFTSRDGTRLAGTLTIPAAPATPATAQRPLPAVVLLHGSGALDRDETIGPNKIFLQIANALSNAGYVVLRYDKRGVAKSGGSLKGVTRDDLVDDARAALAFVRNDPAADRRRLYLLGHSEGAELAPSVAVSDPDVRGIMLLGAPAIPLDDVLVEQLTRGMTGAEYDKRAAQLREQYARIKAGTSGDPNEPWLRTSFAIDPAALVASVPCPIFIAQGGKDIQILPKHLPRLVDAANAAHRDVTARTFPNDNHLFIPVPGDAPSTGDEYLVAGLVDAAMLAAAESWLAAH